VPEDEDGGGESRDRHERSERPARREPREPREPRPARSLEGAAVTFEGGVETTDGEEEDDNFNHEGTPNDPPSHSDARPAGGAGAGDPRRRRRGRSGPPRGPRTPR